MRTWLKAVLFFSSISPMFLILVIQNFNFEKLSTKMSNITSIFLVSSWFAYILLAFFAIPNIILFIILRQSKKNTPSNCTVTSINLKSGEVLNYFATYIIPLLSFKTDKLNDIIVFVLLLIILTIIYTYTNMFFINPVLILLGYQIVEVNQSVVIITKSNLHNGDNINIYSIANNIYFGVK